AGCSIRGPRHHSRRSQPPLHTPFFQRATGFIMLLLQCRYFIITRHPVYKQPQIYLFLTYLIRESERLPPNVAAWSYHRLAKSRSPLTHTISVLPSCPTTPSGRAMPPKIASTISVAITPKAKARFWRMIV